MAGKPNRILWLAALATLAFAIPACVGDVPDQVDPDPDPNPDPDPDPTPDPDPAALTVSGTVVPYFEATRGIPTGIVADITSDGILPPQIVQSGVDGAFSMVNVPAAGVFFAEVVGPAPTFMPTRNMAITVVNENVTTQLFAAELAAVQQQYLGAGNIPMTADTGFVVLDIQDALGAPIANIAPADITLIDNGVTPPAVVTLDPATQGPYFFGPPVDAGGQLITGDLVDLAAQPATGVFPIAGGINKARAGLLNLPAGDYTLQVVDNNVDPPVTYSAALKTSPNAVTLLQVGGADPLAPVPPPPGGALSFENDIYPRLQKASEGGLGCASNGCHTAGNPFVMARPATEVFAELTNPARLGSGPLLDLATVENSLFLMNPVYEDPPDHPNATFTSAQSAGYIMFMTWIQEGALP